MNDPSRQCVQEIDRSRGFLNHKRRQDATYTVTFRLADSLPVTVLNDLKQERRKLERQIACNRTMTPADLQRLTFLMSDQIERSLDSGYGACWLGRDEIAALVKDALLHFQGIRYELEAWVIMPNHVHAVVTPAIDFELSSILHSWKSFTATKVNPVIGNRDGRLWQVESYDRVLRTEEELVKQCEYVINNPVNAGLCDRPEQWRWSSAFDYDDAS